VLYRPEAEEPARFIAYTGKFDAVRLLTEADEERIHFDVSATNVVVVYGREREQRMLADPDVCARVGGALKLCVDRSDELRYSVFVLGDRPLAVEPLTERGWWSWAAVSPDGRSIIAQWSGYECAGHRAALIVDGRPRALTDGPSEARGWTTDGRAIVSARKDCGTPGASLVSPDGEREPIAGSPERSLSPRSADDLR